MVFIGSVSLKGFDIGHTIRIGILRSSTRQTDRQACILIPNTRFKRCTFMPSLWGFGNSANKYDYTRTFILDKLPNRFKYCVDGYGINSSTEVSVRINGILIGNLKPGGNPTETCFDIDPSILREGSNTVLFTQNSPVQTWGVGNFRPTPSDPIVAPIIMLLMSDESQAKAQSQAASKTEAEQ